MRVVQVHFETSLSDRKNGLYPLPSIVDSGFILNVDFLILLLRM